MFPIDYQDHAFYKFIFTTEKLIHVHFTSTQSLCMKLDVATQSDNCNKDDMLYNSVTSLVLKDSDLLIMIHTRNRHANVFVYFPHIFLKIFEAQKQKR